MIERSTEFRLTTPRAGAADDGLTLSGYAAVFDQPTRIDSWEGAFNETIREGAFRKTIRERTPVLQFEHGRHPLIGSLPIGRVDALREDSHGLHVTARLIDNWATSPVREAIAAGAINGMSFRFEVVREEWHDNAGVRITDPAELQRLLWESGERGPITRTLLEVRMHELGPVVFPAYEGTEVGVRMAAAVRSADPAMVRAIRASLSTDNLPDIDPDAVRGLLMPVEVAPSPTTFAGGFTSTASTITLSVGGGGVGGGATVRASTTSDAPVTDDHPAAPAAAPVSDHPSPSTHDARRAYMRRAYLASRKA